MENPLFNTIMIVLVEHRGLGITLRSYSTWQGHGQTGGASVRGG